MNDNKRGNIQKDNRKAASPVFELGQFGRESIVTTNPTDDFDDEAGEKTLVCDTGENYLDELSVWIGKWGEQSKAENTLRSAQAEYEKEKSGATKQHFDMAAKHLVEVLKQQRELAKLPWGFGVSFGLKDFPDMGTGVVALTGNVRLFACAQNKKSPPLLLF